MNKIMAFFNQTTLFHIRDAMSLYNPTLRLLERRERFITEVTSIQSSKLRKTTQIFGMSVVDLGNALIE
jgi:hypothetical protein